MTVVNASKWKDLMDCNSRYYKNPELSTHYFNWEVLCASNQDSFNLTVQAMQSKQLAKRTIGQQQTTKSSKQHPTYLQK